MAVYPGSRRIFAALAIGLMAAVSAEAASGDWACKEAGYVHIASFNVYKLGGIEKRYT